jgi:hypothetical protein
MYYKGSLYVFLPSTGVLYKSINASKSNALIDFMRIDSTNLIKYNIDCYSFIHNDTIYNLGGYGYWRWNGQLRHFDNNTHEWNITPLNKELAITEDRDRTPVLWHQYKNGKIYSLNYLEGNESVISQSEDKLKIIDSVAELNLATKSWKIKGVLSTDIKKNIGRLFKIADLDSGILVENNGNIEYWNFIQNAIYKISNTNYTHFLVSKYRMYPIIWNDGDMLYYSTSFEAKNIDSIKININDFTKTGKQIYIESKPIKDHFNLTIVLTGVSILLLIGLIFLLKTKIKSKKSILDPNIENINNDDFITFSIIEIDLIKLIVKNQNEHRRNTNIDEVNKILGISNKSIDVQKRKRSDTINSINSKYKLLSNNNVVLINRVKSETDRRVNEFYIIKEEKDLLEQHNFYTRM